MLRRDSSRLALGGATTLGVSVSPARTVVDSENTNTNASTSPQSSLLKVDSPFSEGSHTSHIVAASYTPDTSRFVDLLDRDPAEAVRFCDGLLADLSPGDASEHRRWANNLGMALRRSGDLRGAMRVHLLTRPLLEGADPLSRGCHHHGKGRVHAALKEVAEGLCEYDTARQLFLRAGHDSYAASADNNSALLLIRSDRPREARPFANRAIEVWRSLGLSDLLAEGLETKAQSYLRESEMLRGGSVCSSG